MTTTAVTNSPAAKVGPAPMTWLAGTRTLGIRVGRIDALLQKVQAGLDFAHLARLEKYLDLPSERMAQLVGIPTRTLARRKASGKLTAEESDRLLRASRVVELAVDLFEGDTSQARQWLTSEHPALGGVQPLDFASTDVGAREVENLIGRLQHGVFA